jgi:hypothetical protein
MTKITTKSIREHLISKSWKEKVNFEKTKIYESPDKKYEIEYNDNFSNLCDENGFGWVMTINNSRHESLACCDIEYMEQIFALIDIYKNY